MAGFVRIFLIVATIVVGSYSDLDISKYLKVCNRNSVDVNDCMVEAVQNGLAVLADGIKELGLPPLDPFLQNELKMSYDRNQITAKMHMKDIYVVGLKDATVLDARVKADDDRLYIEIDLKAPKVTIEGSYEGVGRYNALKINAYGKFNTTMTGLKWTWKLKGIPVKVGADTFVKINLLHMRPDVDNMVTHLTNNNAESKDLIDFGSRFVNENWRLLYSELVPFAQANWNKTGTKIANKIFMKIPYDQVLPISS